MLKPQVQSFPSEQPSAGALVKKIVPGNFISTVKHDICSDVVLLCHFKSALSAADYACVNNPKYSQPASQRQAQIGSRELQTTVLGSLLHQFKCLNRLDKTSPTSATQVTMWQLHFVWCRSKRLVNGCGSRTLLLQGGCPV